MFRENKGHLQISFFDLERQLSARKRKKIEESEEYNFYQLVFCKIKEKDFAVLYSENGSRPNAPVNTLVASIILLHRKGWTIRQLFEQIDFNLLTRTALGLKGLEETPFCEATFFNFQNRLLNHFIKTGENLLERVFDRLTAEQLKKLQIKTNIQRTDSFMAMSNIRSYGRVQLLIEMLIRLYRVLKEKERKGFKELLTPYIKQTSGQYIYKLERTDIPHELEKLGEIYHKLYTALREEYGEIEIFRIFERVYQEHFTVTEGRVKVKANEEMQSGTLQSPDDIDATYRKKGKKAGRGQSINVAETANPDNELNIITDIAVYPNNTDDSEILNERIERIKEKTPELEELHTDGAYGSEDNDKKMEELGITHVQTGVRGRKSKVEIKIEETEAGEYEVECPLQKVKSERGRKKYKACFDKEVCDKCPLSADCPTLIQKEGRVYYFEHADYLAKKRKRNIENLPPERMKIRPNVEATVKEFMKPLNHKGKLRVRGRFKTAIYAFCMGISINFGRIYRHLTGNPDLGEALGLIRAERKIILTNLVQVGQKMCSNFLTVILEITKRHHAKPAVNSWQVA